MEREERRAGAGRRVVVIGNDDLSEETGRALEALGAQVDYLNEPDEDDLRCVVRDVHRIAAALLATMLLGEEPESVVCLGDDAHLRFPDGRLERAELDTLAG